LPYHSDALGQQWTDLDASLQVLVLDLMDVAGAGWCALSVVIIALVFFTRRTQHGFVRYLIPIAILVFYVPTLIATLNVTNLTPATAPWYGNAVAIAATVLSFLIEAPWNSDKSRKRTRVTSHIDD